MGGPRPPDSRSSEVQLETGGSRFLLRLRTKRRGHVSRRDLDTDRLERRLEAPVIVAALLTIPLTLAQAQGREGGWVVAGDWVVWAVFALEYLIMVAVVGDRWDYTRRNWFNVAIVILS